MARVVREWDDGAAAKNFTQSIATAMKEAYFSEVEKIVREGFEGTEGR